MDRNTTEWLITLAFAALCWLVPREAAMARAQAAKRSLVYRMRWQPSCGGGFIIDNKISGFPRGIDADGDWGIGGNEIR